MPPVATLDADLARTVRRAAHMRQGFYVVVLLVALAGQVSGAVETLHIPLLAAIPAVGALELGGIVVLANADVRRRLGERASPPACCPPPSPPARWRSTGWPTPTTCSAASSPACRRWATWCG
jgi:hypothetical protein